MSHPMYVNREVASLLEAVVRLLSVKPSSTHTGSLAGSRILRDDRIVHIDRGEPAASVNRTEAFQG